MKQWGAQGLPSSAMIAGTERDRTKITDDDPVNARILSLISDLSNTVLAKTRAAELHR